MTLALNIDRISAVLLSDGWHEVVYDKEGKSSFLLDAYEFLWDDDPHWVGQGDESTGFMFKEKESNARIAGPLSQIHAVVYK